MKEEEIKIIIEKYYKGETTEEEETLLRQYLLSEKNRHHDPDLAGLFDLFSQIGQIDQPEMIIEEPVSIKKSRSLQISWYYSVAASVAFLIIGFLAGGAFQHDDQADERLAALNSEIKEIKSMISYQQVTNLSPSERIQVTYDAREADTLDLEAMHTLIDLMIFDENTNVRLAAADALGKFRNNDKVRQAYINALKKEEDPVVLIKLIDMVIQSKEKKAIPQLERIISSEEQNPAVRQKAATGINKLI